MNALLSTVKYMYLSYKVSRQEISIKVYNNIAQRIKEHGQDIRY